MYDDEVPTKITSLKSRRKVIHSARNAQQGTLNLFAQYSQEDGCGGSVGDQHQYIIAQRPKRCSSAQSAKDDQDDFTSTFAKIQIVQPVLRTGIRRYSKYNSFFTSPESTLQQMLTHHPTRQNQQTVKQYDSNDLNSRDKRESKTKQNEFSSSHRRHFGHRTGSASHCGRRPYAFYPSPSSGSQSHSSHHHNNSRSSDIKNNTMKVNNHSNKGHFLHAASTTRSTQASQNNNENNLEVQKEHLQTCQGDSQLSFPHTLRRKYHNQESTSTQQFPRSGLRRVAPPSPREAVRGVKQIKSARGARQQIQVVNIRPSYLKPTCKTDKAHSKHYTHCMDTPRTSIRCMPQRGASSQLREALTYTSKKPQIVSIINQTTKSNKCKKNVHDGSVNDDDKVHPLGKPSRLHWRTVNPTAPQLFLRAVQDHAQQRVHGVTGFYVQLARNLIANVKANPWSSLTHDVPNAQSTPWDYPYAPPKVIKRKKSEPVCSGYDDDTYHETNDESDDNVSSQPWHIKHQLTLGSCRDQLVALTSIKVSVQQVAEMLWPELRLCPDTNKKSNMNNYKTHNKCDTNYVDSNERSFLTPQPQMRTWLVTYKDFARTFGGGSGAL